MIYLINKNIWQEGKESVVRTQIGEAVLRLELIKKTVRKKIQVYDRYHVPIGTIAKPVFKSGLHYDISYDERVIANFRKRWSFFSNRYILETDGGVQFKVKGDIKNYNLKITRRGSLAARIYPNTNEYSDRYVVEIKNKEYRYVLLCVAVIVALLPRK